MLLYKQKYGVWPGKKNISAWKGGLGPRDARRWELVKRDAVHIKKERDR